MPPWKKNMRTKAKFKASDRYAEQIKREVPPRMSVPIIIRRTTEFSENEPATQIVGGNIDVDDPCYDHVGNF